ncbi:TldD/PmbA family protein [Lutispora saccharofermentans]|uniref:TldD/PmbA family protein n=1 Tax=Lutispora saccharofermentans TaxID=3024236 RepID=A0ABT1NHC4_9FIRM|nr:TldD/PmbA family protein [Lutispora saccharofermentans]MCQ1530469.1 TldD/PmbA family protein [Lutispora saccharofermentans]
MLPQGTIEKVLNAAIETGGDFAEIFVEDKTGEALNMIGGVLEKALSGRDFGIGIRIMKGDFYVYAYTNDPGEENLIKVARIAAQGIRAQKEDLIIDLRRSTIKNRHDIKIMPDSVTRREKISWLRRAHEAAKGYDPVIEQAFISYFDYVQNVLIANTEGVFAEDVRCRNRLGIEAMAVCGTDKETGRTGPGYFGGLEYMRQLDIEAYAKEAAASAKTMLKAGFAPSGKFPVVIENGFGGVLFHEACGHGLESASVAYNSSVFADKLGQPIASSLVTAYDDGTLMNIWGSLNIDDEGTPTQRNLLIENGILKGYLVDKLGSRRMGMDSTGSGRRESYCYPPTARMNNTFIAAGNSTPEEIISNTEYGIYAKELNGGSVNTATGDYNFSISEGYIIRNGKIEEPVKGAALIGNSLDTLKKIDMVGSNLEHGIGMCGAKSGTVPVTVGQPTLRVSELTVGGRKEV